MHAKKHISVIMLGDLVGIPGRALARQFVPELKRRYQADFVIVNGENSAKGGRGITPSVVKELQDGGVDCVTSGNHIFARKEIQAFLPQTKTLLRPLNYPAACPGNGIVFLSSPACQASLAVVCLQGRVFMKDHLLCPFKTLETALSLTCTKTPLVLVDFHAEASSEKMGLGIYFDGKVSAVIGTHTHVPTADARILPRGTGFITDIGMCGSYNSMLGLKPEPVLYTFLTQMPSKFAVEVEAPFILSGVHLVLDAQNGRAVSIEQFSMLEERFSFDENMFGD